MNEVFIHGFLASLLAGMVTGIGGSCVFIKRRYYKSEINLLLNIAAGVMLSASFFALLMPAMENIVGKGENLHIDALKYACKSPLKSICTNNKLIIIINIDNPQTIGV